MTDARPTLSIEGRIRQLLSEWGPPIHLEITNDSAHHSLMPTGETHFRVVMVSDQFTGQNLMKRHRFVNQLLAPLFVSSSLHSVSLKLMSPDEATKAGYSLDRMVCHRHK